MAEAPDDAPVAAGTVIGVDVSERTSKSQTVLSSGNESQGGESDPPAEQKPGKYVCILGVGVYIFLGVFFLSSFL